MRSMKLAIAAGAAAAVAGIGASVPAAASAHHDGQCPPGSRDRDYCESGGGHHHHHHHRQGRERTSWFSSAGEWWGSISPD